MGGSLLNLELGCDKNFFQTALATLISNSKVSKCGVLGRTYQDVAFSGPNLALNQNYNPRARTNIYQK